MNDLGGFLVCGQRGGDPFERAVRLDKNGKCQKKGYKPCYKMSRENTICVKDRRDCPITWIKWAKDKTEVSAEEKKFKNVKVLDSKVNGFLLFSKAVDSLPVISIKMLQEEPCLDPIVEVTPDSQSFYASEIRNWGTKIKCSTPIGAGLSKDTRFKKIGLKTKEETLL